MAIGRETTIRGLTALAIVTPALALGAVHPGVLAFYLLPAAALLGLLAAERGLGFPRLDVPGIVFLGLAAFTLLQLVPLPAGLVELVSPRAFEVRAGALRPLGEGPPGFMPLTLDSTFTVVELAKLLFYLAVYWTTVRLSRRYGSGFAFSLILVAGVMVAGVFLAHRILLAEKVYGFYAPLHRSFREGTFSAPLINANHLAGLLGVTAAVAIGRALQVKERSARVLLVILAAVMGGSLLLTLSRGGIAAFIGGQCLFILLRIVHRLTGKRGEEVPGQLAWLPLGLAISLGLGLFVAQDLIVGEFVQGDTRKLELVVEGLPLAGSFFATGVGRGAFWVGFPLVSDLATQTTFTHAENAIVQLLADWGVIVGGLALVAMIAVVGRMLLKPPARVANAAALAALTAFGLHNLVDFNMEVPGVAVVATAILGTLMGSRSPRRKARTVGRLVPAVLAACAVGLAVVVGVFVADHDVDSDERRLRQALASGGERPFTDEAVAELLERHPADWYLPFVIGVRHFQRGESNPLPWLARALELNPRSASAHYYVGSTFLRAGKLDQAMIELRIAALYNPALALPAAEVLVSHVPRFDDLAPIARVREDKLELWAALARVLARRGLDGEAEKADLALLALDPNEPRSLGRHARRLALRGETEEALDFTARLGALEDYGPSAALLEADIHGRRSDTARAVAVLEGALEQHPRHDQLLTSLAYSRQKGGDLAGALEAVAVLKTIDTTSKGRARVAVLEANLMHASGRNQEALSALRHAHSLDPSNVGILRRMARLAEASGDRRRAVEALRKLIVAEPRVESHRQRLRKLEGGRRGAEPGDR